MQKAIISSSNQIKRNLQLYTLGEVDEVWIKNHNGPIMQNKEDSQKESSSRESIGNIEDERYNLVEVCSRIRNKLDSAEEQQKQLALDALDTQITITGQKVKLHLELGAEPQDPKPLTIARTSASLCTGNYNFKAIYVLA